MKCLKHVKYIKSLLKSLRVHMFFQNTKNIDWVWHFQNVNERLSHEVIVSFILSLESTSFFAIVSIVVSINVSHYIVYHCWIVVSVVSFTLTFQLWLLWCCFCCWLFLLCLLVEHGFEVLSNLVNLLWISMIWKVLRQLFKESFDSIWSRTSIQCCANFGTELFVVLFWVKVDCRFSLLSFISTSKELVHEIFLLSLFH